MANRSRFWLFLVLMAGASVSGSGQESPVAAPERPSWGEAMARVHARFQGKAGTFAHFGDSITESLAFWTPLKYDRRNATPELELAFQKVNAYLQPECWRDWKGPEFGNQGGQRVRWADENVAAWLEKLNPEVALVMFGTNDLRDVEVVEYRQRLRSVVRKCLSHGTVVILSTIPPRHDFVAKAASFAEAARQVARELHVPLIDFHAEILKRRPTDWDGTMDRFQAFQGHDVPTLIARDGVHPSAPKQYENDYSAEGLRCHGYNLRSLLVLMKYAEVIDTLKNTSVAERASRPSLVKGWYPRAPRAACADRRGDQGGQCRRAVRGGPPGPAGRNHPAGRWGLQDAAARWSSPPMGSPSEHASGRRWRRGS